MEYQIIVCMNVTVDFQNHSCLAFIHRDIIRFQKRIDDSPSTFEYLYGYESTPDSQFMLGIYRPGSDPLTPKFFNELSTVLEQLVSCSCPVVVCGDFNVHFDLRDDGNAVRLKRHAPVVRIRAACHRAKSCAWSRSWLGHHQEERDWCSQSARRRTDVWPRPRPPSEKCQMAVR